MKRFARLVIHRIRFLPWWVIDFKQMRAYSKFRKEHGYYTFKHAPETKYYRHIINKAKAKARAAR